MASNYLEPSALAPKAGPTVNRLVVDEMVFIKPIISTGATSHPKEIAVLGETDGTVKVSNYGKVSTTLTAMALDDNGEQMMSLYGNVSGTVTAVELETGGEFKNSLYGTASGSRTAVKVESTGEVDIVSHGKDSGGTIDPIRTNDNQQMFYEPYEKWIVVPPYVVTSGDAVAWNPGLTSADIIYLEMWVYDFTAGASAVTIYHDVGGGGTPGNAEYLMNAENLGANTRLELPAIVIKGDDDIRAFSTAGADATIHFRAKQVART